MKNRALKYTLAFAIVGIITTLLIAYVERNTLKTYEHNLPFISLGDNVKNRSIRAHLSMEELFSGDPSVNFQRDVVPIFASCSSILQGAYEGKETEIGDFKKTDDEETRAILKESIVEVEKLITVAQERWELHQSGADDDQALDSRFDAAFDRFTAILDKLIDHVNNNVEEDRTYLNYLSWISIALIALAFLVLGVMIFRLQHATDNLVQENHKQLQDQEQSVGSLSSFIESISAGDYSVDLNMEGDEKLKTTLITMRDKLRENADDDHKRNWATSGLAQIGEILRTTTKSSEELFDKIIKFVVKYTKSNQGGLFILNEENEESKYLELVACYAFERKKYIQKKISSGEGLIGQCYLEGARIYLMEVPQEYISITSGLGGANPNALLIVPLRVNEKIFGVLELATFIKYDDFEIDLIEKLAESIGSTISTVRVNESTRVLLEKTQQQAEEMRAQEEEMRQNMEELEATQEQMHRQMTELNTLKESLEKERYLFGSLMDNLPDAIYFKDTRSRFTRVSKHLADHFAASSEELIGKTDFDFQDEAHARKAFEDEQNIINTKKPMIDFLEKETKEDGTEFWMSTTKMPLVNLNGEIVGTFGISRDVTKLHTLVKELGSAQKTMQAIINNIPRAVFWKDRELRFQGCNIQFARVAGLKSPHDLIGHTDFDMPWKDHAEAYRADDLRVMNNKESRIDQEERNVNSEGVESWVLTSKVPVVNEDGEVVAVLGMFEDITERKRMEDDVQAKLKELVDLKTMLENNKI
jgi:PAS domain S-box-containing protein